MRGSWGAGSFRMKYEGAINSMMRRMRETQSEDMRQYYQKFLSNRPCSACGGPAHPHRGAGRQDRGPHHRRGHRPLRGRRLPVLRRARPQGLRGHDRRRAAEGDPLPPALPARRGPRLPDARPARAVALGRRGPAHPPGQPDRQRADRRHLRPRRAVDRPAPARQPEAAGGAQAPARHRQHRGRGRARPRGHGGVGLADRLRAGRGPPRRRGRGGGHAGRGDAVEGEPHRALPVRRAGDRDPASGAGSGTGARSPWSGPARTTSRT